jgi:dTDP-4-amino-4,6-dideoxygalactose transaminase/nucleoside-diphosphate-sugar epimerase
MKKRILVTGGAGYLGTIICRKLLERGDEVRCFDRMMFGEEPVKDLQKKEGFELVVGDITRLYEHPDLFDDIDGVIHLAGLANDPSCDIRPEMTERVNYRATMDMAQKAKENGIKPFINASSCSVYGAGASGELKETSPLRPVSLYAEVKVRCERDLNTMADDSFYPVHMRQATLFGLSPRMRFDLAVNVMVLHGTTNNKIFVLGGGKQWRPFLHIEDSADCFLAALDRCEGLSGEAINIGTNKLNYQICDLAELVQKNLPDVELEVAPGDADRRTYNVNFDKMTELLGVTPGWTVENSVKEIHEALLGGGLPDPQSSRYYNIKLLKELVETPATMGGEPACDEFVPFCLPLVGKEEEDEVIATLRSGWLTTGPRTQRFEEMAREYLGCKQAVAVNSCTGALHLTLAGLGIGPGDEVITTPVTWPATANVVVHLGAKPVFVDVEKETFNINPDLIEEKITDKTKAIMPVHMAGHPCDMDRISEIAEKHGLDVVEDAAHAIGAAYKGRRVGTMSRASCFSFYPIKNMTTIEGGLIATDDAELAERIRILSLHGITKDAWKRYSASGSQHWEVVVPGYKYNMTDVQAALGLHQLPKLESFIKKRALMADFYSTGLSAADGLVSTPVDSKDIRHAWHLYIIVLDTDKLSVDRDAFMTGLKAENVGTGIHFRSLHMQGYYRETFNFKPEDYPNAAYLTDRIISLPLYPKMNEEEMEGVLRATTKLLLYYSKEK